MTTSKPTPGPKPTFQRIGDKVYWQSSKGELVLPLRVKTGFYRTLTTIPDPVVQFAKVLEHFDLDDAIEALDDLDLSDGSKLAADYFEAMGELVQASPGE